MVTLAAPPSPRNTALAPIAILIEPSPRVAGSIRDLLGLAGYRIDTATEADAALDAATLAIVEADRGARAIRAITRLHGEYPGLPLVSVLPWWDDDEREVLHLVRFVLHVPVRDDQLQGLAAFARSLIGQSRAAASAAPRTIERRREDYVSISTMPVSTS